MLIRFGVSNWRSIKEFQELSLVATSLKDPGPTLLTAGSVDRPLLPGAAIYGANASGKSNFLSAVSFLRSMVMESYRQGKPDSEIPLSPFRLDPACEELPSKFQIDFDHEGVRFHFAVEATLKRVVREVLYAFPQRRRQLWYRREGDEFTFGKELRGENRSIEGLTRNNCLFISTAITSNHQQLTSVGRFFSDAIIFYQDVPGFGHPIFRRYSQDAGYKSKIVALLQAADVGISDFEKEAKPVTEKSREFFLGINALLKKFADQEVGPFDDEETLADINSKLRFMHTCSKGKMALDLASESRGTQQLLNLLPPTLDALERGQILFIDEMDTSLHPLLSKKLIRLFQSSATNAKGAQLIFTTHDTNLLDRELLRRDQIWFAEKDREGASSIYPLSDIRTRSGDNIERGYLEGRYGAIPFLGDFEALLADRPDDEKVADVAAE